MAQIIIKVVLIGFLMQVNFVLADIFRHQDEDGAVSYSDKPSASATKITPATKTYRYKYKVKRVYDGDTIILQNGHRVRLLGVNTPEIKSRHRQGEEGGRQATQWLKDKLGTANVFLEYDDEKHDKYQRDLAHLFLDNGEHINLSLIESGLGMLSIIPPNVRYSKRLQQAEKKAMSQQLGIWGTGSYQAIPNERLLKDKSISGWHRFLATPNKVTESRKFIRLIISDKINIRIPKENLNYFPDIGNYIGQSLEIRGWASRKKDHFSILVRHPSAITILKPSIN